MFSISLKLHDLLLVFIALSLVLVSYGAMNRLDDAKRPLVDLAVTITPQINIVSAEYPKVSSQTRQEVDAVLAIDFSGSMCCDSEDGKRKATDPNELRLKAAELMVGSLASDVFPRTTRMGYIAFGETVEVISPLTSVKEIEARKELINLLNTPKVTSYTNIIDTLRETEKLFFPNGKRDSKNIPALVLLTDGQPTGSALGNTEAGIQEQVRLLLDKGLVIFVVILRNPEGEEVPELTKWRKIWKGIADENIRFNYMEAQKADELEGVYNKIRGRLVNEGAKPGERKTYDPTDANANIEIPPNLLQAHLLVGKSQSVTDIELLDPNGQSFNQLLEQDPLNELLVTNLYHRYRIHQPHGGKWRLTTASKEPIYYLLNPESLFNARIAWQNGNPYLNADKPTQLPIVVVDDKGHPSTKEFKLEVSILQVVTNQETGAIVEQPVMLPSPASETLENGTILYHTKISPDHLDNNKKQMPIQITGEANDGTLVNLSLTQLPIAHPPTKGIEVKTDYQSVCMDEQLTWFPTVSIQCGNWVTVTLKVAETDRLLPNSLTGEIFLADGTVVAMKVVDNATMQQTIGPFTTAGNYLMAVTAKGEVEKGLVWQDQTNFAVKLDWPGWIPQWQNQLWIGSVLLLICALWKPVIVALLLPIFRILRLAPSGYYAEKRETKYPDSIYEQALKRRKLFALTIGDSYDNSDHDLNVSHKCSDDLDEDSNFFNKSVGQMVRLLKLNRCKRLQGRLVTLPFKGVRIETKEGFNFIGDKNPLEIGFIQNPLYFCEIDWTEKK